ncbi:hypothetical protein Pan216_20750 [Planctomycetes bacterium Pan216]|uniref:Uncharacterized protein n=1 Tax=Kolteria novifilia TaxID=2527975 RepID=A0A518B2K3_9BACT|nr:hypothetical protein Pan216_20750 [Planctomycetes bacterium Pan216]
MTEQQMIAALNEMVATLSKRIGLEEDQGNREALEDAVSNLRQAIICLEDVD